MKERSKMNDDRRLAMEYFLLEMRKCIADMEMITANSNMESQRGDWTANWNAPYQAAVRDYNDAKANYEIEGRK